MSPRRTSSRRSWGRSGSALEAATVPQGSFHPGGGRRVNAETLLILDWALRTALFFFLAVFAFCLVFASLRWRRKKRSLARYFEEELARRFADGEDDSNQSPQPGYTPSTNRWRTVFHSLALSGGLSAVFFLLLSFAPLPFLHNFATERSWRTDPLRLTALTFERYYEGFSLEGEVWNQSEEPVEGLRAIITIWDRNRDTLEKLVEEVRPQPLEPGKAGRFSLRYDENSPFLYGYQVEFVDAEGSLLPHVEGFDVD